jgi:hypothetical protein
MGSFKGIISIRKLMGCVPFKSTHSNLFKATHAYVAL